MILIAIMSRASQVDMKKLEKAEAKLKVTMHSAMLMSFFISVRDESLPHSG